MSVMTTWKCGVYHLLLTCHVRRHQNTVISVREFAVFLFVTPSVYGPRCRNKCLATITLQPANLLYGICDSQYIYCENVSLIFCDTVQAVSKL